MIGIVVSLLTDRAWFTRLQWLILIAEAIIGAAVIIRVPYTEIDWKAYMQEVGEHDGFLSGELDYFKMKGDTGPLVYPAGFVYLYSALYYITQRGDNIRLGQWIFLGLYLAVQWLATTLYHRSRVIPQWVIPVLCLSYRIHSIFMLRLFNDCFAIAFAYAAIYYMINNRWSIACVLFSLGVSIKMNILLFAPGMLLVLFLRFGGVRTIPKLAICAIIQLALGAPFLQHHAWAYIKMSFDLGRQFMFKWTVNFKYLPEDIFLSKKLHMSLLIATIIGMIGILHESERRRGRGGLIRSCRHQLALTPTPPAEATAPVTASSDDSQLGYNGTRLSSNDIISTMFLSNFVGIVFSRSLHYQFYVWYWHTIPFLLATIPLLSIQRGKWYGRVIGCIVRLAILAAIEWVWVKFPATPVSSATLTLMHIIIFTSHLLPVGKPVQVHEHQS